MNAKKLITVMLVFAFVATCFAATANAKLIENTGYYVTTINYDYVVRYSNGDISLFNDGVQVAFIYNVGSFYIVYDKNGAHICKDFIIYASSGNKTVTSDTDCVWPNEHNPSRTPIGGPNDPSQHL